jgi:putative transposase
MNKNTTPPETLSMGSRDVLNEFLHQGACDMLTKAIEAEVQAYLAQHEHCRDEKGHRLVVRNGTLPGRTIQTPSNLPEALAIAPVLNLAGLS